MRLLLGFLVAVSLNAQTTGGEWFQRGVELESQQKYAEAIEAFEKARALQAAPGLVGFKIAASHAALGHAAEAVAGLGRLARSGWTGIALVDTDSRFNALRETAGFKAVRDEVQANATPCRNPKRPEYRQFDFWIGEWNVFQTGTTQQAGTSSIKLILKDCVIHERWVGVGGGEGQSFNKYNPDQQQWEQYWVDGGPGRTFFAGHRIGDEMRYEADATTPAGQPLRRRMTFFKNPDGTVRQFCEASADGGKSFYVEYDFLYKLKEK